MSVFQFSNLSLVGVNPDLFVPCIELVPPYENVSHAAVPEHLRSTMIHDKRHSFAVDGMYTIGSQSCTINPVNDFHKHSRTPLPGRTFTFDQIISRKHAAITRKGSILMLDDMGSTNHTSVKRGNAVIHVMKGKTFLLDHDDRIFFASAAAGTNGSNIYQYRVVVRPDAEEPEPKRARTSVQQIDRQARPVPTVMPRQRHDLGQGRRKMVQVNLGREKPFEMRKSTWVTEGSCNFKWQRSIYRSDEFDKIFAIGDVHGDYEVLSACLRMTGCVALGEEEHTLAWVPPPNPVAIVLLGDVVDRWRFELNAVRHVVDNIERGAGEFSEEEKVVLRNVNSLAAAAERGGSAIFRLVGNHEIKQMDISGSIEDNFLYQNYYASPLSMGMTVPEVAVAQAAFESVMEANKKKGKSEPRKHVPPEVTGKWKGRLRDFTQGEMHTLVSACTPKAVLKIGRFVFVHGGLTDSAINHATLKQKNFVEWANELLRDFLHNKIDADDVDFNALLYGEKGILWDRTVAWTSEENVYDDQQCKMYMEDDVFSELNANLGPTHEPTSSMVVAHCPQSELPMYGLTGWVPNGERKVNDLWSSASTEVAVGVAPFARVPRNTFQAINTTCNGMVWRVDASMSRAFRATDAKPALLLAQRPTILEIEKKHFTVNTWNSVL